MPAEMTMLADHPARQLLDFNQKLDINLLDTVVNSMYHDIGTQVRVNLFICFNFFWALNNLFGWSRKVGNLSFLIPTSEKVGENVFLT